MTGYELLTFVVRSSQRVHWTLVLSSIFTLVINWVPENNNEIVLCLHLFALCFYLYFEVLWGLNLDRDVTTWLPVSSLTFNYSLNGFTSTLKLLYLKWLGPSRMSFLFCIRSRNFRFGKINKSQTANNPWAISHKMFSVINVQRS